MPNLEQQLEIIKRGSIEVINEAELLNKLEKSQKSGKPLIVKLGADPTAPDLHLGHSVVLRKLRDFQDLGHEVHFLIGDFTSRIGDPTGKTKTRPPLTEKEIQDNAKTYAEQVFKILDRSKTKIRFNSEWCSQLSGVDMIKLAGQMNVARMLEREDFKNRYTSGQSISIHEFLYPLIQGYDSVAMKADVEIGGQDQRFNLLVGRDLQKNAGMLQQVLVLLPLLEGLDGKDKMSKSLGNAIGITENPKDMFGKIMSIPDTLMEKYFEYLTRVPSMTYKKLIASSPRDAKIMLAKEIVTLFHSEESGIKEEKNFVNQFSKRNFDQAEAEELFAGTDRPLSKALVEWKLCSSASEAKRLLQQGGCKLIHGEEIVTLKEDASTSDLKVGQLLKVGKKKLFRLK
ncbi:MAG: tyrosine--tRNA ligase [Deltaproteobacteria bacterium CG11_big_fil_rev_8_21_14_0_20_45_16]|nr:MAG: tyrosine--tRNA ligase [Deltaproteobacteria bacterium CG11_big_fil_rev_8_21_14_0_20_45_16]